MEADGQKADHNRNGGINIHSVVSKMEFIIIRKKTCFRKKTGLFALGWFRRRDHIIDSRMETIVIQDVTADPELSSYCPPISRYTASSSRGL